MPDEPHGVRDIVLHHRDGQVERISEYHHSYDPLQYALLHPHGTDGWSLEMKRELDITATEYYASAAGGRLRHGRGGPALLSASPSAVSADGNAAWPHQRR